LGDCSSYELTDALRTRLGRGWIDIAGQRCSDVPAFAPKKLLFDYGRRRMAVID